MTHQQSSLEKDRYFVKVHGCHYDRRFLPLLVNGGFVVIFGETDGELAIRTVVQNDDLLMQQLAGCTFGVHVGTLYKVDDDWLIFDVTRWCLRTTYASLKIKQRARHLCADADQPILG